MEQLRYKGKFITKQQLEKKQACIRSMAQLQRRRNTSQEEELSVGEELLEACKEYDAPLQPVYNEMLVLVKDDTQLLKMVKVAVKNGVKLKGEVLDCQKNVFYKETGTDLEFTVEQIVLQLPSPAFVIGRRNGYHLLRKEVEDYVGNTLHILKEIEKKPYKLW